jgi:AraC-like DNA-binding protein
VDCVPACALLADSKIALKDISYQLGYSSPAHFSGRSKHRSGWRPGEYRRNMQ